MTTTDTTHEAVPTSSIEQVANEHRALGETVDRLGKTTDPHLLLPRLEKLRHQLEHHFIAEEASDGVRRDVGKLAPFLLGSLDQIFDEHRRFLDDIDGLRAKVRDCLEGPLAEITGDVTALIRRLRDHEVRETELLRDVYYTDYGEGN